MADRKFGQDWLIALYLARPTSFFSYSLKKKISFFFCFFDTKLSPDSLTLECRSL